MSVARLIVAGLAALSLGACATVPPPQPAAAANPGPPASAFTKAGPLLGEDAKQLIRQLGTPRLDIREATMRKLQFANGRCVLDAYLYPPAPGKEPVVTHVDARSLAGIDIDPASCASALQAR